ncbi:MAG: hypothetical protein NUV46_04435, partial [Nanoarchaeota archaeon]|nr:hypothetical protein [Nanoarchaeota archaeon]
MMKKGVVAFSLLFLFVIFFVVISSFVVLAKSYVGCGGSWSSPDGACYTRSPEVPGNDICSSYTSVS